MWGITQRNSRAVLEAAVQVIDKAADTLPTGIHLKILLATECLVGSSPVYFAELGEEILGELTKTVQANE